MALVMVQYECRMANQGFSREDAAVFLTFSEDADALRNGMRAAMNNFSFPWVLPDAFSFVCCCRNTLANNRNQNTLPHLGSNGVYHSHTQLVKNVTLLRNGTNFEINGCETIKIFEKYIPNADDLVPFFLGQLGFLNTKADTLRIIIW